MSVYDPLRDHLVRLRNSELQMSFSEIEKILGRSLPRSAERPQWWANQARTGHSQREAWRAAGYDAFLLAGSRRVTFRKTQLSGAGSLPSQVDRKYKPQSVGSKGAPKDVTTDWYWEGNVVETIASFLEESGWAVISKADTHVKERGVDIRATKDGKALLIEVKGFPSKTYRDPRRAGERKPTNPTNQAQQWYSHALLKVMRLQTKHPEAVVALGLPDFPRYRTLFEETRPALKKLGIAFLIVQETGNVQMWGL